MKIMSPEEVSIYEVEANANNERIIREIQEKALALGYTEVASIDELGLSAEQLANDHLKTIRIGDKELRRYKFLKGTHKMTGQDVFVLWSSFPTTNRYGNIEAIFFSPSYFNGVAHGNDFNTGEMSGNLEKALSLPVYGKTKAESTA